MAGGLSRYDEFIPTYVDAHQRMTIVPWQERRPSRNARLAAWFLLVIPVAVAVVYPIAQNYLRAAGLLARIADPHATGWIANYDVHQVDVRDTSFDFRGHTIAARVYLPRGVGFAPGIVVVHGMHELGIDEPRLVNFARSMAASGFYVMTPLVPGIADYRIEAESADVIGSAAKGFAQELQVPRVGVFAISFSGGLALLAASDPQYAPSIAWVASVGGYYDLAHVLRFFATGDAVRPDGSAEHLTQHEYGPLIVVYDEPQDFFNAHDAPLAHDALKLLLHDRGKDSEQLTLKMTSDGQRVMQNIYQKHRDGLTASIVAEINKRSDKLAAASPAGHLRFIDVPVLLLHGSDDNVIPPTEMLWLKRDLPSDELVGALESPAITHVEVGSKVSLGERLRLVHWMALMMHTARSSEAGKGLENAPAGMWTLSPSRAGCWFRLVTRSGDAQRRSALRMTIRDTIFLSSSTW
jgi:pimeloyl-ACP methyl ester carboxylesterase